MILYHGSNMDIESIDLERSSVGKDFGCGFYLTASREQAERMGRRRARLYGGEMVVSTFEFDENAARAAGLITIETFLNELKFKEGVTYQYFFATERSVQFLKKL